MSKAIVEKLNFQKYDQIAVLNKPEETDDLAELTGYDTSLECSYDLSLAVFSETNFGKRLALVSRTF